MSNLRTLFRVVRIVGLLAIVAILFRSEYRFFHGHLPHILNPRIHLYAVGSVLLIPFFWTLLAATIIGHLGKRIVERRMKKAEAEE
jgi:nitrate/nitrite transporter NarK